MNKSEYISIQDFLLKYNVCFNVLRNSLRFNGIESTTIPGDKRRKFITIYQEEIIAESLYFEGAITEAIIPSSMNQ